MKKIRFNLNIKECKNDYRPVKWPIKYPYWCSGEDERNFIMVAYADSAAEVRKLWPESMNFEIEEVDKIEFTDRFQKPDWYTEPENKKVISKDIPLDIDLIELIKELKKRMQFFIDEGTVTFSKYGTDKINAITESIVALPETNKYKKCSEASVVAMLNERDGVFYVKFINYLLNNLK